MDTCITAPSTEPGSTAPQRWFPGFDGDAQAWEHVMVPWPSVLDVERVLRARTHRRSLVGRVRSLCAGAVEAVRSSTARAHA
jgi:hypothetical protein